MPNKRTRYFEPLSTDGPMLLLSQPVVEAASVVIAYEIRCGVELGGMCAVGGAFRLEKVDGHWAVTETVNQWVA